MAHSVGEFSGVFKNLAQCEAQTKRAVRGGGRLFMRESNSGSLFCSVALLVSLCTSSALVLVAKALS